MLSPRTRTLVVAAALTAAAAAPSAAPAQAPAPATPQTLTLDSWQSATTAAAWQRNTWQKSLVWCNTEVDGGYLRWRNVIKDGKCGTVVKSAPLVKKQVYEVKVSGLVSHWRGVWPGTCGSPIPSHDAKRGADYNAGTDAQWTFAVKRGTAACQRLKSKLPRIGTAFRVNLDGQAAPGEWQQPWRGLTKKWVTKNHTYSFLVKGTGKSVWFSFYDHWVTDNYGSFTIQLTPLPATPAGITEVPETAPPASTEPGYSIDE